MRILNVISSIAPDSGGPSESLRQVGSLLQDRGHTVEVACVDGPDAGFLESFPLPVHALGPGSGPFQFSATMRQWLLANAGAYDALIVRGLWQYPGFATRAAALKVGRPYWVFPHGMLDPWFNRRYPLKALKKRLYWPWQHAVLRDAEAVLFTCEEERVLARRSFRPYRVRERVVSYGTATPPELTEGQRLAFETAFPVTKGKEVVLFLGRLHPKKGCDILLQAFADRYGNRPEVMLVMAGPDRDGYGDRLRALAESLRIADRVLWAGMVRDELKWGAFRSAKVFVLPSHQENFGIAVAEALACGLPVLISKPVNIWREVVGDGAGFAEEDTVEGIYRLFATWDGISDRDRSEMSSKAVACFNNRFTVEQAATSLLEALGRSRRDPRQ
jgi:glycosyltransferase involved in cell wall biosynthesis